LNIEFQSKIKKCPITKGFELILIELESLKLKIIHFNIIERKATPSMYEDENIIHELVSYTRDQAANKEAIN
jgi:hypothetical protein